MNYTENQLFRYSDLDIPYLISKAAGQAEKNKY